MPLYPILTSLFLGLITFGSNILSINNLETKLLDAVAHEDYIFVEQAIDTNLITPNKKIEGKTLLIYACIYDKAEMVLLLLNKGAALEMPCDEGLTAEEYAIINNSIHALAQIIIVKS